MPDSDVTSPTSPTLEALQNHSRDLRRARPPDIAVLTNENRVPLRPDVSRRESRLGLRNIFSKSKTTKDEKLVEETPPPSRGTSRNGSKRSSLANFGDWPHRLHSSRSEISLVNSPPASIKSPASGTSSTSSRLRQNNIASNQNKLRQPGPPKMRESIIAFEPPPLFKMYPQAIKHGTLPACVTPIDALYRFHEPKNSLQHSNFSSSTLALDQFEFGRKVETERKKKSKHSPEWTSKVYALVTSGYLLQYAAEGRFDRLPEKILHLTRDSAAYASDLIPGKHWVVQVASYMDAEGNASLDAKSFKSKFALRGVEKRQVSNMLLVFEAPEAMDAWLAVLRREIELLGGKKKLSETGKPEADGTSLRAQASQRTLVVRDPARFSHIISPQDFTWSEENALANPPEESDVTETPLERTSESTVDDGSSLVSSDGQRLDSLRDSGSGSSGNRLSFVSSGQRTIVSSTDSSPTHSPVRASFSSHDEDFLLQLNHKPLPPTPEVRPRPRPNAAAIANRRQSMQTMIPGFDPRLEAVGRSHATPPVVSTPVHEPKQQFVPNFSVPHTVGRRYSAMNLSKDASRTDQSQTSDREGPIRPIRRSPPTRLAMSRPLSIVLDQPSPRSPYSPTTSNNSQGSSVLLDSPSIFNSPWARNTPKPRPHERTETPVSRTLKQMTDEARPSSSGTFRGFHGKHNSRASQNSSQLRLDIDSSFIVRPNWTQPVEPAVVPEETRRASSSLEMRRASMVPNFGHQPSKPTFLLADNPSHQHRHSFIHPKQSSLASIEEPTSYALAPPPTCSPKRSAPSLKGLQRESLSKQFSGVDLGDKALSTRRSLPHLADGPPPAPPPTCALPPIPTKRSSNLLRSIKA
ncbi:hypothetical protein F4804DRAFT_331558 [Jackrogersella minutella]|nr:hypothetical protein F4804DRAFT_331558 [Jackrogersella minutella]